MLCPSLTMTFDLKDLLKLSLIRNHSINSMSNSICELEPLTLTESNIYILKHICDVFYISSRKLFPSKLAWNISNIQVHHLIYSFLSATVSAFLYCIIFILIWLFFLVQYQPRLVERLGFLITCKTNWWIRGSQGKGIRQLCTIYAKTHYISCLMCTHHNLYILNCIIYRSNEKLFQF